MADMRFSKNNDVLGTTNRGNAAESSLCTLCRADCQGKCETWLSSLVGRKLLYPRDFGTVTAGANNTTHVGVNYNALRIQGYAYGAHGLSKGLSNDPDDCIFPNVSLETEFGNKMKTKIRVPLMTGALGSTFIAAKYWDSFAIGGSLVGIPVVIGENVVGVDQKSKIGKQKARKGKITNAPELERRINTYLRYHDGYGAIIVQLNVEDTRNGVAEFVADKYGNKCIIELKWGQGAKDIGGEIQVTSLEYATFLKERGYVVDPDPTKPQVKQAFKKGAIKSFARHSRLGGTNLDTVEQVQEDFMASVDYLRSIGFKRVTLKTGSYGMEELAMAIKFATDSKCDLLTIDGAPGGTGMSPWRMMEEWGMPTLYLHAAAYEFCQRLADKGKRVPDIAFAGGFSSEDGVFKALALGSPYTRAVCMGRALMIPGMVGKNIENWLKDGKLPNTVSQFGSTAEEIFVNYEDVKNLVGAAETKNIPLGAIGIYSYAEKIRVGLQQLMAGARCFSVPAITRRELMSLTEDCAKVTGIPYLMEAYRDEAMAIMNG